MDAGRKSGGGRIVATFYDNCAKIWGGSPAAESIKGGIESNSSSDASSESLLLGLADSSVTECDSDNVNDEHESAGSAIKEDNTNNKSQDLIAHLKEARNAKLAKPISREKQLLDIAKQDLELKQGIMKQMKEMDKGQTAQMKTLTDSVKTLTTVLSGSLANLMQMQTQKTNQSYMFPMAMPPMQMLGIPNTGQQQYAPQQIQQQSTSVCLGQQVNESNEQSIDLNNYDAEELKKIIVQANSIHS